MRTQRKERAEEEVGGAEQPWGSGRPRVWGTLQGAWRLGWGSPRGTQRRQLSKMTLGISRWLAGTRSRGVGNIFLGSALL